MSPLSWDKKYYELLKQLIGSLHRGTAVVQPLNGVDLLIHIYTVCPRSKGLLYLNSFLGSSWSCQSGTLNIMTMLWRKVVLYQHIIDIICHIKTIKDSLSKKCFIKFNHASSTRGSTANQWVIPKRNTLSHSLSSTNDVFIALQVLWSSIKFFVLSKYLATK